LESKSSFPFAFFAQELQIKAGVVPQLLVSKAKKLSRWKMRFACKLAVLIPCRNAQRTLNKNTSLKPSEFGVCLVQPPIAVGHFD